MTYKRVAQLRTPDDFRAYLQSLGVEIPFDDVLADAGQSPLAQSYTVNGRVVGNRFAVLPMEGWDAESDGSPSELVRRRWHRFGQSGAKLVWGCEAVAVRHDGRANPHQLVLNAQTVGASADLRAEMAEVHRRAFGSTDDFMIGLQLTHSGRFARPNDKKRLEPQILYPHPILNRKHQLADDYPVLTDEQIDDLIKDFVQAAVLSQQAGFDFVDIKHCHGYLGHEFLSAFQRQGRYGGSFENRTRFLRELIAGIRRDAPGLQIGVRLSAFDWIPFRPAEDGRGEPEPFQGEYKNAFGGNGSGTGIDLRETHAFLDVLESLDVRLVCITAGSPYYNPHIQRPALFPPSDGYQPPEDPLVGVARQIAVTADLKRVHPTLVVVGSGYSYLQEWVPHVAQHVVRSGMAEVVGLGRMVLSYPEMMADILAGQPLERKRICRTFSDCTTAPRMGLISGCYPLDAFYKERPEADALTAFKQESKR